MYIANELKVTKPNYEMDSIRESFIDNLQQIVEKFFYDKSLFSEDDFTYYILDEHVLNTNCNKDIFTCVYLEINQPNNYKPQLKKPGKLKQMWLDKTKDKYHIPELFITLSDIRKGLCETCLKHFDKNNIVWQDKYSVCIKSTVLDNENKKHDYYFKIIPALTYHNKNNVKGLVYYSGNDIQIEYPSKFYENFEAKNKKTKDKFRQIVLILKNILLKDKSCERLPSEIIETLVYNVPNSMLKDDDLNSIINVVNFIRNNPLRDFKTIDEQDYAFSSLYRGMSAFYSRHILKIIEKTLTKSN